MLLASSRNAPRGTGCVWSTGCRAGPAEGKKTQNKQVRGTGWLGDIFSWVWDSWAGLEVADFPWLQTMTAMCWGNGLSIWLSCGWSPPTETTLLSIILLTIQYKLEHSNFASFQCCFPYLNFPLHWCILNSVYKMNNYLKKTYRSHTKMFCCLLAGLSFSPHIT